MTKSEVPPTWSPKRYPFRKEPPCIGYYFIFIYLFFLLASPKKKKQTDKQKERWQGHRNSCGQLQRARKLIKKKIKTRNIKKHSDTRKTTATYNKLLDETRDEHYYILNR